jgi:hypothetical protein
MRIQDLTLAAALLLALTSPLAAETPSPTGHWAGVLRVPNNEINVDIDIVRDAQGALNGTISILSENLKGMPLLSVSLEGKTVTFVGRKDQPFTGTLSDDGKWIVGELTLAEYRIPLTFERTGEAHVSAPLRSDAVSKAIEGRWLGRVEAGGATVRLVMTVTNDADGKATARVVNLDEGETELPIAIVEAGSAISFDAPAVGGSFKGTLDEARATIAGTWRQGSIAATATFSRATAGR